MENDTKVDNTELVLIAEIDYCYFMIRQANAELSKRKTPVTAQDIAKHLEWIIERKDTLNNQFGHTHTLTCDKETLASIKSILDKY